MISRHVICVLTIITVTLSACTSPTAAPQAEPTSGPDLALTITAQANMLQAVTLTALAPTSTPESAATTAPPVTETPSRVIVTVSANTNCRSGPGVVYEIIGALTVGQQAEVVGQNSSAGYWIINNPTGPGTCWLWEEHTTITGDTASLQEFAVPPTTTPPAVLAPVIDRVEVRFDSSSGSLIALLDVYYFDGEGDATLADWQLISTSIEVTGTIKDNSIAPSPSQRRGAVVTGQWNCGPKIYSVALAVTIRDQAGHASNSVSVTFPCNN